jgi:ankyrin repeat protein
MKHLVSILLLLAFLSAPCRALHGPQETPKTPEEEQAAADAALLEAVEKGDESRLNSLLDSGADVNAKTAQGTTALMIAAFYKRPKLLSALIARGADVNAGNRLGSTALIIACLSNHVKMVRELLVAGADSNAKGVDGMTPLWAVTHSASPDKKSIRRIMELLIIYGAVQQE